MRSNKLIFLYYELLYDLNFTVIILYMKNLDDLLKQAELSHSERVVYKAGLDKPRKTIELVKELKLPRSTVAAAIDSLEAMGLCRAEPLDKKTFLYTMLPVKYLNTFLSQQATKLSNLMDDIASFKQPEEQIKFQEARGQEEVQRLLGLALRCKTRKWQIIASKNNPIRFMPKSYTEYFKKVRKERQIESLSLWDKSGKKTLGMYDLLMRKPRYVPENLSKSLPGLLMAFDDSLLFIEGETIPQAVLIESPAISRTFRIVFEMAWLHVKPSKE